MSNLKPAPYPADTRAKGWRFELDYERIRQSDTWALAPADVRPWLLMLWMASWEQTPCGSLPDDDALVAARIGMQPKAFAKVRDVLMRGWARADDGRLYHDTITARVLEMLEYRAKNAKRVADFKARMREQQAANALLQGDSPAKNDTGTGTGTGTTLSTKEKAPAGADGFDQAWTEYPKRPGNSKADAHKAWKARLKEGHKAEAMTEGVKRYAAYCKAQATEPQFIKLAATFFGPGLHFQDEWKADATSAVAPTETVEQYQARMAAERAADRARATPPPASVLAIVGRKPVEAA